MHNHGMAVLPQPLSVFGPQLGTSLELARMVDRMYAEISHDVSGAGAVVGGIQHGADGVAGNGPGIVVGPQHGDVGCPVEIGL